LLNRLSLRMKKRSAIARFSTVGIQMGIIIAGCAWIGDFLDKKTQNETPWYTLFLMLFGLGAGLTLIIREALNTKKDEDE